MHPRARRLRTRRATCTGMIVRHQVQPQELNLPAAEWEAPPPGRGRTGRSPRRPWRAGAGRPFGCCRKGDAPLLDPLHDRGEVVVHQQQVRWRCARRRCRSCPWRRRSPPRPAPGRRSPRRSVTATKWPARLSRRTIASFCSGSVRAKIRVSAITGAGPAAGPDRLRVDAVDQAGELRAGEHLRRLRSRAPAPARWSGRSGWSPVIIFTSTPERRHSAIAPGTSGRTGSIRPTTPSSSRPR